MLFHSYAYSALLALTILACVCLPARFRWLILLCASAAFYVAWSPVYLLLLFATTTSCHFAARLIDRSGQSLRVKSCCLAATIGLNFGILFLFKYFGLFASTSNFLIGSTFPVDLGFLLPVGISFYTFQAIGYTIDVFRGKVKAETSLARTTLFISFFPQLVAGPIERASRLLPALSEPIYFRWRNLRLGGWLILWGLFKKVVVADRLSLLVDHAYDAPEHAGGLLLLVATYAFAFQIYCDFSGYSDMAIGSARLFGIDLMVNFRTPYFAASVGEFWSRWHISLSTWFRDYVYIPLGGNRVGRSRWVLNILLVFALSGLWHGAKWTFVVWGLLHGAVLVLERFVAALRGEPVKQQGISMRIFKVFITFHVVLLAWVFFRAGTFGQATEIVADIASVTSWSPLVLPAVFNRFELAVAVLGLTWMLSLEMYTAGNLKRVVGMRPRWISRGVILGTLLLILNFGIFNHPNQFVYFQF